MILLLLGLFGCACSACPSVFKAPGPEGKGCYSFDLSTMPKTTYTMNDTYPEPYLVAAPCHDADTLSCKSCNGKSHATSSAYQVLCSADRCLSLNDNGGGAFSVAPNSNPKTGIKLTLNGGDGGRTVIYDLQCDPSAKLSGPTSPIHYNALLYTVSWPTSAACPSFDAGESCALPTPAPSPLPIPTAPQLLYQKHEIMALIHFNMVS